jgi:hypothetical protein
MLRGVRHAARPLTQIRINQNSEHNFPMARRFEIGAPFAFQAKRRKQRVSKTKAAFQRPPALTEI